MIADLKPYSAMKDSGVEWLGEVPEHWEVRQLGRLGAFSKGNGGTKDDEVPEGVPCVRYGDLYTRHRFFIEDTKACVLPTRAADYTPIHYGDVLFTGSGETIEEIGKSAVNLLSEPTCCGGDVVIFRPAIQADAKFLGLATDCPQAAHQKSCMGRGITIMHIYGDELKYLFVTLPPLSEQAAIVRVLDHVDRRVRRLVRAKRKLVALLTEQKQAIIHRAVTRGLDPDVPLKDSGVEWLGEVPEHWEVTRVKTEFKCLNSRRIPLSGTERGEMTSHRYDYYGASGVIDKVEDFLFDDELLLIAEDGANLVLRNLPLAIIARGKFWVNNHAHILKPRRGNLEYLAAVIESLNYLPWISGAAQPKLTKDRLMSIAIAAPPTEEQDEIIGTVHEQTASLTTAITHAEREIELLNEYRTRLIADVVTGKLDVREAAAALPEIDPLAAEGEPDDSLDSDTEAELDEMDAIPEEAEA